MLLINLIDSFLLRTQDVHYYKFFHVNINVSNATDHNPKSPSIWHLLLLLLLLFFLVVTVLASALLSVWEVDLVLNYIYFLQLVLFYSNIPNFLYEIIRTILFMSVVATIAGYTKEPPPSKTLKKSKDQLIVIIKQSKIAETCGIQ